MKTHTILLVSIFTSLLVKAQNIFPDNGDVLLRGKSIKIERPNTTGGWARGTFFYQFEDINTRIAGYGLLGSASKPSLLYLAHGKDPWSSRLGIYVKTNGNVGIGTTNPNARLQVSSYATDSEISKNSISNTFKTSTQTNVTSYDKAMYSGLINYKIPAGITDSGYKIGVDASSYSGYDVFAGTLQNNFGVWARAGLYKATPGARIKYAIAVNAEVLTNAAGTSIDNAIGVKISTGEKGAADIKNRYDLYAATGNAKNYFAGTVGIGTTNPAEKFDVNGTAKSKRVLVDTEVESSLLELKGPNSSGLDYYANTDIYSSLKLKDQADKIRVAFSIRSGQHSFFRLNDKNQNESIGFSEGGDLGSFIHLPKASSRIVIGSWGSYLSDEGHKLVIKDGSAKIEGDIITNSKIGVGIASTDIPTDYKLAVAGKIVVEEVRVELQNEWPDYVFMNDYKLPTLKDVEKQIQNIGHLKDIPSADEVKKNGILVGQINAKLLQKIEELTLYTIQQEKEIQLQKDKNNSLENRLEKIEILIHNSNIKK